MSRRQEIREEAKRLHKKKWSANDIAIRTGLSFKEVSRIVESAENSKFDGKRKHNETGN